MKYLSITAVIVVFSVNFAVAAQFKTRGSDSVFVWKDSNSYSKAIKLIQDGVHKTNQNLVLRLLSCIPKETDSITIVDGGFFSSTILVTSGKFAGCEGVVANEDIQ